MNNDVRGGVTHVTDYVQTTAQNLNNDIRGGVKQLGDGIQNLNNDIRSGVTHVTDYVQTTADTAKHGAQEFLVNTGDTLKAGSTHVRDMFHKNVITPGQQLKRNAGQFIDNGKALVNDFVAQNSKLQDFHTGLQRHGQQLKHNAGQVINHGKTLINNFVGTQKMNSENVQTKDDTNIPAQYTGLQGVREKILLNAMQKSGMKGTEAAQFLSQMAHESDRFQAMEEYASGADYEGRADLGNTQKGDGVRFKGRGYIQLTGRANYRTFGRLVGVDLEKHPEKAEDPEIAAKIAIAYWNERVRGRVESFSDTEQVTKLINGGDRNLADRKELFEQYNSAVPTSTSASTNGNGGNEPSQPIQGTGRLELSSASQNQLNNIITYAEKNNVGSSNGDCFKFVWKYLSSSGYGNIKSWGDLPNMKSGEARHFAEYMNSSPKHLVEAGLQRLDVGTFSNPITNPHDSRIPEGAVIVVGPGSTGTRHETAGDIVIKGRNGRFINDGPNMDYGTKQGWKGRLLGVYIPK